MKTVILDDDPTGTQSASDVRVLLTWTAETLADALRDDDAVYVQTNSRALSADDAGRLAVALSEQIRHVEHTVDARILTVLRGDSTLRGHVLLESDLHGGDRHPILFVPAFPQAGRVTIDSVHLVLVGDGLTPVGDTEYARDANFGFRSSNLIDYVREKGARAAVGVGVRALRDTEGEALRSQLLRTAPGEVVVPDAETDDDIELIATVVRRMTAGGHRVVVRCAAPLAAALAGSTSHGVPPTLELPPRRGILVVAGSHTAGAAAQLAHLEESEGVVPLVVDTILAKADPVAEGERVGREALRRLTRGELTVIASERVQRPENSSLEDGARVMTALTRAVAACGKAAGAVVTKGGITAAETIRTGLGAESARVLGQLETGVSVWSLANPRIQVAIVPGNIGTDETITRSVAAFRAVARSPA